MPRRGNNKFVEWMTAAGLAFGFSLLAAPPMSAEPQSGSPAQGEATAQTPQTPPAAQADKSPPAETPTTDVQPSQAAGGDSAKTRTDADKAAATTEKASTAKTPPKKRRVYSRSGICKNLDHLARKHKLPPLFFARLIWQESRFNPYAVSPKGAAGIAQFMPDTAALWGLDDPFEPGQALIKSAQYLSWLRRKLGNLGLAAAGYNAGSQRVADWMAGSGYMPLETRNYVYAITGYSIEDWAANKAEFVEIKLDKKMPATACKQLALALKQERAGIINVSLPIGADSPRRKRSKRGRRGRVPKYARPLPPPPWGVQLAGSFSRAAAMRQFNTIKRRYGKIIGGRRIVLKSSRQGGRGRRIFHRVRVGMKSRSAADTLCNRLKAAGAACVVLKN